MSIATSPWIRDVADVELLVGHAQRDDEAHELDDHEGCHRVVHDDEAEGQRLDDAAAWGCRRCSPVIATDAVPDVPTYTIMLGDASTPVISPPNAPATPWVWKTPSVSSTFWKMRVLPSLFIDSHGSTPAPMPIAKAAYALT